MSMTPREIVHELNRHIIGQDDAKRAVAIALRNQMCIRDRIIPDRFIYASDPARRSSANIAGPVLVSFIPGSR